MNFIASHSNNRIKSVYASASQETQKLVLMLLTMDMVFIALHIVYLQGFTSNKLLSIERDRGYSEVYQYTKEIWACTLLLMLAAKGPRSVFISWTVLFAYILVDDSFLLHERYGTKASEYFSFQPMLGLRAKDFGELLVSAIAGSIILSLIAFTTLRSNSREKNISKNIFFQFLLLVFFGVFVDMIHAAAPWGYELLGLIEDGGEMIVLTLLLGYIFNLGSSKEDKSNTPTQQQR